MNLRALRSAQSAADELEASLSSVQTFHDVLLCVALAYAVCAVGLAAVGGSRQLPTQPLLIGRWGPAGLVASP